MSTELRQLFSAEYLLLRSHTSNDCTGFCFPQTCNFNIGLFLTFQLSKISLMLRLSRAFLEYFHTLRKGISIWSCFCLMVTGYLLHWKSGKFLIQTAVEILSHYLLHYHGENFFISYTHLFLRKVSNLLFVAIVVLY